MGADPNIVGRHFHFLKELARRLRSDAYDCTTIRRSHSATNLFPGLQPLFESIATASPTGRKIDERLVEEWNPFSQRIVLPNEEPPAMSRFERRFSLASVHAQTLIEWSHEAIHLLALEPFFCGYPIRSKKEFVDRNLTGEALAFWYADMVVTRGLRQLVPNAELVYSRSAMSNSSFHPEEAFRQMRIRSRRDILQLYIASFLGERTPLGASSKAIPRHLAKELFGFYSATRYTLENWYDILLKFEFFDGYWSRFCGNTGLPSLWSDGILRGLATLNMKQYAIRVGLELMPVLARARRDQIARVRVRRHIQTRAYFAWFLQKAVERGWTSCKLKQSNCIAADIGDYLGGLEAELASLGEGTPCTTIVENIRRLDARYGRRARREFRKSGAFMKYRYRIFPHFPETRGLVGLSDPLSQFSSAEIMAMFVSILQRYSWSNQSTSVARLAAQVMNSGTAGNGETLAAAFNRFMIHPEILPIWSVLPGDISPAHNRYREPLFEYK